MPLLGHHPSEIVIDRLSRREARYSSPEFAIDSHECSVPRDTIYQLLGSMDQLLSLSKGNVIRSDNSLRLIDVFCEKPHFAKTLV